MAKSKSRRQQSAKTTVAEKPAPVEVEASAPVAPAEPLPPPTGWQKVALGVTIVLVLVWLGFLAALATQKIGGSGDARKDVPATRRAAPPPADDTPDPDQ